MSRIPIITTKAFTILEAAREEGDKWKVKAKLGGEIRDLEIHGTAEDVLKKLGSTDQISPFLLKVFLSNQKSNS